MSPEAVRWRLSTAMTKLATDVPERVVLYTGSSAMFPDNTVRLMGMGERVLPDMLVSVGISVYLIYLYL